MKILILTSSYPEASSPFAGIFVRTLAEKLANRGHRIHVFARGRTRGTQIENGITVSRFAALLSSQHEPLAGFLDRLENVDKKRAMRSYLEASLIPQMRYALCNKSFDAAIVHWPFPMALALPRKIRPVLGIFHSGDVALAQRMRRLPLMSDILRRIDGRLSHRWFVSERLQQEWNALSHTNRRTDRVAPMPLNDAFLESPSTFHEASQTHPRILSVGRMVHQKGFDRLLGVALRKPDWTFTLVGDGPLRRDLQRTAASLPNVHWKTPMHQTELVHTMRKHDALVLGSRTTKTRSEGSPLAILEAFSQGLPVVLPQSLKFDPKITCTALHQYRDEDLDSLTESIFQATRADAAAKQRACELAQIFRADESVDFIEACFRSKI